MILNHVIDNHSIGVNCCTRSITTVLKSNNIEISETDVFGMSSGLGFIYQYYKNEGYFVSGRNESLELNLCYLLGIDYKQGYSDDFDHTWILNKEYIDQDIPVIVDLNIEFLPYYKGYFDEGFRFGLHNAVLVGYDHEHAYLLDDRFIDVKAVPLDLYKLSRSLDNSSNAPRNGWRVMLPAAGIDIRCDQFTFFLAVETMVYRMLHPFAFKMGLEGIRMFFREVKLWSKNSFDDVRRQNYQTASFLLEKLGTGGGNFRRMYSRFIKNSSERYHLDNEFNIVSQKYAILSVEWKRLSQLLDKMSLDDSLILQQEFLDISSFIYEQEKEAIYLLKRLLEEGYPYDAKGRNIKRIIT
ncbi:BtrH N-terminal domain-containing protein [Paenibacillus crassostreae]|nr:BtrH N-terminal domain-containing protein [Paenibacillus crassostreae]